MYIYIYEYKHINIRYIAHRAFFRVVHADNLQCEQQFRRQHTLNLLRSTNLAVPSATHSLPHLEIDNRSPQRVNPNRVLGIPLPALLSNLSVSISNYMLTASDIAAPPVRERPPCICMYFHVHLSIYL